MKNVKFGEKVKAAPAWHIYNGQILQLNNGDTLYVNAMRIGYQPAAKEFTYADVRAGMTTNQKY